MYLIYPIPPITPIQPITPPPEILSPPLQDDGSSLFPLPSTQSDPANYAALADFNLLHHPPQRNPAKNHAIKKLENEVREKCQKTKSNH